MRIRDWSSDVCSSDLALLVEKRDEHGAPRRPKAALAPAPRIACASVKEEELDSLLDSSIESGARFAPNVPILRAPNVPIGFTRVSTGTVDGFSGRKRSSSRPSSHSLWGRYPGSDWRFAILRRSNAKPDGDR